jgi:hypothetical protein
LKREQAYLEREATREIRSKREKEFQKQQRNRGGIPEDLRFSTANVVSYRIPGEHQYKSCGTFYVQPFAVIAPARRVTLTEQRWRAAGLLPGAGTQGRQPDPGTQAGRAASEQRKLLRTLDERRRETEMLLRKPVMTFTPLHVAVTKPQRAVAALAATTRGGVGGGDGGGMGGASGGTSRGCTLFGLSPLPLDLSVADAAASPTQRRGEESAGVAASSEEGVAGAVEGEEGVAEVPLGAAFAGAAGVRRRRLPRDGSPSTKTARRTTGKTPDYPYLGRMSLDAPTWEHPIEAELAHTVSRGARGGEFSANCVCVFCCCDAHPLDFFVFNNMLVESKHIQMHERWTTITTIISTTTHEKKITSLKTCSHRPCVRPVGLASAEQRPRQV